MMAIHNGMTFHTTSRPSAVSVESRAIPMPQRSSHQLPLQHQHQHQHHPCPTHPQSKFGPSSQEKTSRSVSVSIPFTSANRSREKTAQVFSPLRDPTLLSDLPLPTVAVEDDNDNEMEIDFGADGENFPPNCARSVAVQQKTTEKAHTNEQTTVQSSQDAKGAKDAEKTQKDDSHRFQLSSDGLDLNQNLDIEGEGVIEGFDFQPFTIIGKYFS